LAGYDPNTEDGEARPSRIAWFSIFASGLVVGLILGLGLSPSGYASAAREVARFAGLGGVPTDQPASVAETLPAPRTPSASTDAASTDAALAGGPDDSNPPVPVYRTRAAPRVEAPAPPLSIPVPASAPNSPPMPLVGGPITSALIPASGEHHVTVGVFGDSLADGLWAALYRQMHESKRVDVVKLSQVATGLTRYDYVNVQQKTEAQLAKQHVDVAVILFGTNDQQGIVEADKVYPFGTPGWRELYARRIDTLVATLRRQGATVYWVGLPKMRAEGFDKRAQLLNGVYQERMAALGVRFIPTDGATEDPRGDYAAYLPVGPMGKMTLMRANDGMHMSMPGYLRIAAPVSASIRSDVAKLQSRRSGGGVSASFGQ
jgi:hypothetical protein